MGSGGGSAAPGPGRPVTTPLDTVHANIVGTVHLRAAHSAGSVVIELSDDGRGLDRRKILAKALERGLVAPGGGRTTQRDEPHRPGVWCGSHRLVSPHDMGALRCARSLSGT